MSWRPPLHMMCWCHSLSRWMPPRVGLCLLEDPQLQGLWRLHSSLHSVSCHCSLLHCLRQIPDGSHCFPTSSHKANQVRLLAPQACNRLVIPTQPYSSQILPASLLWTSGVHVMERDCFISNDICGCQNCHGKAGRTGCTCLPRLGSAIIGGAGPQGGGAARCCRALALPRLWRCRPPCKAQADQTLLSASLLGKSLGPLPARSGCMAMWPNDTRCRSSRSSLPQSQGLFTIIEA